MRTRLKARTRARTASSVVALLLFAAVLPASAGAQGLPTVTAQTPPPSLPLRLAIQTEGANGVFTGKFHNQLAGLRLDVLASPNVSFGGYLGYVNLKGKEGRASNILPYAVVEYRVGAPTDAVRFPLRFATGYLPRNGPVVRMAAGLAFNLSQRIELVTELLAPMFWVTNDQMLLSMNWSIELAIRL